MLATSLIVRPHVLMSELRGGLVCLARDSLTVRTSVIAREFMVFQ